MKVTEYVGTPLVVIHVLGELFYRSSHNAAGLYSVFLPPGAVDVTHALFIKMSSRFSWLGEIRVISTCRGKCLPQKVFGCFTHLMEVAKIQVDENDVLASFFLELLNGLLGLIRVTSSHVDFCVHAWHFLRRGQWHSFEFTPFSPCRRCIRFLKNTRLDGNKQNMKSLTSIPSGDKDDLARHVDHVLCAPIVRVHV